MKTVGVICAMAVEVEGLKEKMSDKKDHTFAGMVFTEGLINQTKVVAVECGVGKVNAAMCAQIIIDKFNPQVVINSGVAGSVSTELEIGDTVVATCVVQHDMNSSALGDPVGEMSLGEEKLIYIPCSKEIAEKLEAAALKENCKVKKGVIASGDLFVSSLQQRLKIAHRFNALACEMEGAAIGHVCYRNNVPFCVFRAISDDLSQNEGVDFMTFCKMASEKSINVINTFINL